MTPAIKLLDRHKVDYQIRHYDAGEELRHFGEHAAKALGQDTGQVFKTLIGIIDGNTRSPAVALVAVTDQLDLKKLAAACNGRKAVMADPQQAQRSTGYVIGGISPLGQKQKYITLIDQRAAEYPSIFISGGKRGLQLELAPDDLLDLLDARYCALAK